jgi:hypothetical protein
MKTKRFVILVLLIIISVVSSYAQQFVMPNYSAAIRPTIPRPNINYSYYNNGKPADPSVKYRFSIVLKNDSTFESRTKINIDEKQNFIEVKHDNGKRVIKPSETKSISRVTSEGKMLIGMPVDSCWLFKIKLGKLSLYSFLAEEDSDFAVAFRQGENPVLPLSKENLLPYMKDDEKLVNLLEKKKFVKAVLQYNQKK